MTQISFSFLFKVESDQRLKKWYLMLSWLTLSIIRYGSRVKWSNPEKGLAPSPTSQCSSYWEGSLLVTLDYGRQLYLFSIWNNKALIIISCGVISTHRGPIYIEIPFICLYSVIRWKLFVTVVSQIKPEKKRRLGINGSNKSPRTTLYIFFLPTPYIYIYIYISD